MCVYGIGLPFDHPIWQNLPPCPHIVEVPLRPVVPPVRQVMREFGFRAPDECACSPRGLCAFHELLPRIEDCDCDY